MSKKKQFDVDSLVLQTAGPELIRSAIALRQQEQSHRVTAFIAGTINQVETLTKRGTVTDNQLLLRIKSNTDGVFWAISACFFILLAILRKIK